MDTIDIVISLIKGIETKKRLCELDLVAKHKKELSNGLNKYIINILISVFSYLYIK